MITGHISRITEQGETRTGEQTLYFQTLEIALPATAPATPAQTITTKLTQTTQPTYRVGQKVVVTQQTGAQGAEWVIADYARLDPLLVLSILFAGLVIVIGRWRGLLSLIALSSSFMIVAKVTLPLIMAGWNPIFVSILTASCILPINFYFSHGWHIKTHLALASTILSLLVTTILAQVFITASYLTGLSSEEAGFLLVEKPEFANTIQSLILAGIIVGALGILDDVTVSQTSVVFELKKANPSFGWLELYRRGMTIGQDHISSVVNTLVLVYTGAALPLLLLFTDSNRSLAELLNLEIVAEEIIKTLTGSIGLIFAAPLTTALAAFALSAGWVKNKDLTTESHSHAHHH